MVNTDTKYSLPIKSVSLFIINIIFLVFLTFHQHSYACNITLSDELICKGEESTLTASGGVSYQWSTGESSADITVSPQATKSYSVTVIDSDGFHCEYSASVKVINISSAKVNKSKTCTGEEVTFSASASPEGGTYSWSGIISGEEASITRIIDTPGNHSATITYTYEGKSCTKNVSITIIELVSISPKSCDLFKQGELISKDDFTITTEPAGNEEQVELETKTIVSDDLSNASIVDQKPGGRGTFEVVMKCGSSKAKTTVAVVDENAKIDYTFKEVDVNSIKAIVKDIADTFEPKCGPNASGKLTVTRQPKKCNCEVKYFDNISGTITGSLSDCCLPEFPLQFGIFRVEVKACGSFEVSLEGSFEPNCERENDWCATLSGKGAGTLTLAGCLVDCDIVSMQLSGGASINASGKWCTNGENDAKLCIGDWNYQFKVTTWHWTVFSTSGTLSSLPTKCAFLNE